MSGKTAANVILDANIGAMRRAGNEPDAEAMEALSEKVENSYQETTDIRHATPRRHSTVGDDIINPQETNLTKIHNRYCRHIWHACCQMKD